MKQKSDLVVAIRADHHVAITTAQQLVAAARERADALSGEISDARERLAESLALLRRSTAVMTWPLVASIGTDAPVPGGRDADAATATEGRTFAAVTELIEQVERAAAHDVGLSERLIADIKLAIQGETDPSLLMGILLEGIVQTVLERLAVAERRDTIVALCSLLCDRINQRGVGSG